MITDIKKPKNNIDIATLINPSLIWNVILFNCNCHTFDTVIEELMESLGCSYAKASQFANVADQLGSVKIYEGDKKNSERIADTLGRAGLIVKLNQ